MPTEAQRRHQQELKRKKRQDHREEKRRQRGGDGKDAQPIGIGHSCAVMSPESATLRTFKQADESMCRELSMRPGNGNGRCLNCESPFWICRVCYLQEGKVVFAPNRADCLVINRKSGLCEFHAEHGLQVSRADVKRQAARAVSIPLSPPAPVKLPPVAPSSGTFGVPPDGIVEINDGYYEAKSVEALRLAELMPWRRNWVSQLNEKFLGGANWQSKERGLTVGHFTIATVELLRHDKGFTEQDLSLIAKLLLRLDFRFATCSASPDGDPRPYIREADGWDESEWGRNMSRWLSKLIRVSADQVKQRQRKAAAMTPKPVVKKVLKRQYPELPLQDVILGDDGHEALVPVSEEVVPEMEMPDLYEALGGGVIEKLDVDDICRNPNQPRTYFNEEELVAFGNELKVIQIQPIFVTANTSGSEHKYMLVDGERRWRACRLVGKKWLWGAVVEIADPDKLFLTSFFANEHREQLNPIDEAASFKKIVDRKMMSVARLANRLNKSTAFIYQRLALLNLCPEVQALMDPRLPSEQRLGSYTAYQLTSIKDPTMQLKFAQEIIDKKIGGGEVAVYIRLRARQEGILRDSRGHTPRKDYRILIHFLQLVNTKTTLFLSMPVSQIRDLFKHRNPADLKTVSEQLSGDIEDLNGLLNLLREIAEEKSSGGKY